MRKGVKIKLYARARAIIRVSRIVFSFFQALKAIALLRMGRQEEAVSTMNTVLGSHPGDQATLQACTMYFKENSDCMRIIT